MKVARRIFLGGMLALAAMVYAIIASDSIHFARAQTGGSTGVLIGGQGVTVFNTLAMASGTILVGQGAVSNPQVQALSGDCTLNAAGAITCTKTSGSSLGTAALANTGSSGATVPVLNAAATITGAWIYSSHSNVGSNTPALTSCGSSPTISGDDSFGTVTMGSGSPTGCVITFQTAYTGTPNCVVTSQSHLTSFAYSISNTAITTVQTGTSSNIANYACRAQNGG